MADPDESHHVTGHAVDIGPTDADDWLIRKGNRFGLLPDLLQRDLALRTRHHTPAADCPPINVAYVFGLLQFVSTFLIAWLYERHMTRNVDPLARDIRAGIEREAVR